MVYHRRGLYGDRNISYSIEQGEGDSVMDMNEPYGKFEGTIELPAQLTLAAAPTEKKFPWKWVIIGGLGLLLVISLIGKKNAKK